MAKKKTGKKGNSENKYLSTLLIILVSILILMGLLMWRNRVRAQKYGEMQKQLSQSSEPAQIYQLDTENDGVYTDTKYGFTFKYPKNLFVSQTESNNKTEDFSEVSWYLSIKDSQSAFPLQPWLDLRVNNSWSDNERLVNDFNKMYDQKMSVFNSETGATKLKQIAVVGGKGMTLYMPRKENTDAPVHTYLATWIKDNTTIWLSLSMEQDDKDKKYQKIFDSIVSSFKFTN